MNEKAGGVETQFGLADLRGRLDDFGLDVGIGELAHGLAHVRRA